MACQHSSTGFVNCPQCQFDAFVRNNFFTGKMMGANEFRTETRYHAEKLRHHNVRLHGAGVVCGLDVKQHPSVDCRRRYVIVRPGSALDCCGHEIMVSSEEIVDVGGLAQVKALAKDALLHTLQLCVRFHDCATEDVPVLYDECGCDDTRCAPNSILESYAFEVLVDPPVAATEITGAAPDGVIVVSNVHGATGALRAGTGGKVFIIDPTQANRAFVLDPIHRSRQAIVLSANARGVAVAPDGAIAYVVTDPTAPGGACEVLVFTVADGQPLSPVVAGATRTIPGSSNASAFLVGASSEDAHRLLVYDTTTGQLHYWDNQDATHPIKDTQAGSFAIGAGWKALTVPATGHSGYAIDNAGTVQKLDLTNGAKQALALPAGASPVALAVLDVDAQHYLAVASSSDNRIYVVNLAGGAVAATIDVAHDPLILAATGSWLHVYEEQSGNAYVQAISLAALPAGGAAAISGARLVGANPQALVLMLYADGQVGRADSAYFADGDCSDHLWKQLSGCAACDLPDCIVLATVASYRPGFDLLDEPDAPDDLAQSRARIDDRAGRRMLASTATLQAWIECLQLKGGVPGPAGPRGADGQNGTNGTDGVGLNVDLPKIIDIAWVHASTIQLSQLTNLFLSFGTLDEARFRIQQGFDVPPFTVYFNKPVTTDVNRWPDLTRMRSWWRDVFTLEVQMPFALPLGQPVPNTTRRALMSPGYYLPRPLRLLGDIIEVDPDPNGPPPRTPHTHEPWARAVSFIPRRAFFELGLARLYLGLTSQQARQANRETPPPSAEYALEPPTIRIRLDSGFVGVLDAVTHRFGDNVVDGDNVGGRVGIDEVRGGIIRGGKNPSGNLTAGGPFESWISVIDYDLAARDQPAPADPAVVQQMMRTVSAFEMPPSVNLISTEELAALPGVSASLANRLTRERGNGPFVSAEDMRRRLKLTDKEFNVLTTHLLLP